MREGEARGLAKGLAQGRAEGRTEGRAEGAQSFKEELVQEWRKVGMSEEQIKQLLGRFQ